MNKFTKKNFMLVAVLIGSGVIAAALLIAAGIVWIDLLQRIGDTKVAREKVEKLTKAKPAPGEENERLIKQDIEIFKQAANELRKAFGSPLEPAVDAFIKELQPPYASQLTDEQHDRFRVHPANEDEMSQEQIRKLKTRKLSVEDFRGLFQEAFENNPSTINPGFGVIEMAIFHKAGKGLNQSTFTATCNQLEILEVYISNSTRHGGEEIKVAIIVCPVG